MPTIDIGFDPNIFVAGPFTISWHGVLTSVAVLVATAVAFALTRRRGISTHSLDAMMFWVLVCGIAGARLFHVLDHLSFFAAEPLLAFAFWTGGIAVYGSFIGGLLGGAVAARRARLPVRQLLDVAAPAMLVGQIIGRLGCFSNGDAWGAPCVHTVGFCVTYLNPNDLLTPRPSRRANLPVPALRDGRERSPLARAMGCEAPSETARKHVLGGEDRLWPHPVHAHISPSGAENPLGRIRPPRWATGSMTSGTPCPLASLANQ